ncbi:hypothetical protein AMTRI_Chr05g69630 [Amborella trichopoda]
MQFLNLNDNDLFGSLPCSLVALENLNSVELSNNWFSGEFPQALKNWSSLSTLDLSGNDENRLQGPIPKCFENFTTMRIDNGTAGFTGYGPSSMAIVENLSNNHLMGEILEELTNLMGLVFLNLSRNHLSGVIPEKTVKLIQLQSLDDLSNNQLSGLIPPSISSMTSLSVPNLSNNNLTHTYVYLRPHEPPPSVDRIEISNNRFEFPWLDMSNGLGFGLGFGGTILLLFIRSPRLMHVSVAWIKSSLCCCGFASENGKCEQPHLQMH